MDVEGNTIHENKNKMKVKEIVSSLTWFGLIFNGLT